MSSKQDLYVCVLTQVWEYHGHPCEAAGHCRCACKGLAAEQRLCVLCQHRLRCQSGEANHVCACGPVCHQQSGEVFKLSFEVSGACNPQLYPTQGTTKSLTSGLPSMLYLALLPQSESHGGKACTYLVHVAQRDNLLA